MYKIGKNNIFNKFAMVERAEIRNTFIYSPIFETVEEVQTNPFVFKTDALE